MPCPLYCYFKWWGDGIAGWGGGARFLLGYGWGDRGWGIILQFLFFSRAFEFYSLTFLAPLFRWLDDDGYCVCFFDFSFVCLLVPLSRFIAHRNCLSDHHYLDFIGKGRVFWFQSLFRASTLLNTSSLHLSVELIISAGWFVIPVCFTSMFWCW